MSWIGDKVIEIGANWIHGPSEGNPVFCLARQYGLLDPEALTPENQALDTGGHLPWVSNIFSSSGSQQSDLVWKFERLNKLHIFLAVKCVFFWCCIKMKKICDCMLVCLCTKHQTFKKVFVLMQVGSWMSRTSLQLLSYLLSCLVKVQSFRIKKASPIPVWEISYVQRFVSFINLKRKITVHLRRSCYCWDDLLFCCCLYGGETTSCREMERLGLSHQITAAVCDQ